ncbi:MAG: response regulator, partial [Candidatus Desantisbacteria bacterium]
EDIVKGEFFDIAFVDIHMPVMDGLKTLHALRGLTPKTAIVMMDSMPGYLLEEAVRAGAITCIHKPFNIREVRTIVKDIINQGEGNG